MFFYYPKYSLATACAIFVIALPAIIGCYRNSEPPQRGFYHWRTNLSLSLSERSLMDSLGVKRLYVRFFDVDWESSLADAKPLAQLQADTQGLSRFDIIPVVFITNKTLQQLPEDHLPELARRICKKINEQWAMFHRGAPTALQIDCDWSGSTRSKYFALLGHIRKTFSPGAFELSATIRLHQLRDYPTTGVPPVDRGMLMFYNMGELEDWQENNSILNIPKAEPYLKGASRYALPLDIALPAFGWGVVFRDEAMNRLIYPIDDRSLSDTSRFKKIGQQRWQVAKSTYLDGHYLYRGDLIRVERAQANELAAAAQRLSDALRSEPRTVVIYHLDSLLVQRYSYAQLDTAYQLLAPH